MPLKSVARLVVARSLARLVFAAFIVAVPPACAKSEPRGQTVLWVDTDLPIPGFADTLRVERLDASGNVVELRDQTLLNHADWPTSFGIAHVDDAPIRLRLRLFLGKRVRLTNDPHHTTVEQAIDPSYAIDRLVEIQPPQSGIAHALIVLSGYCIGVPSAIEQRRTCVSLGDDDHTDTKARPTDGVLSIDGEPKTSLIGTWSLAAEKSCTGAAQAETGLHDEEVCIPGGWFLFGDKKLTRISPFFLDRYEVTIGRWKAAIAAGFAPPKGALLDPFRSCTTSSPGVHPEDALNCVRWTGARAFCAFEGSARGVEGRTLPSEAQWEFAASGRGWQNEYVWGDEEPSCDRAVYGRFAGTPAPGGSSECYVAGMQQHPFPGGSADVSRDGVFDFAGNVAEWSLDEDDGECWSATRFVDPVCVRTKTPTSLGAAPTKTPHVVRGGAFTDQAFWMWVWRRMGLADDMLAQATSWSPKVGFRCARKGA